MTCAHDWRIVLGLVMPPKDKGGHYEYQGKCEKCGFRTRLNDELTEQIFRKGGLDVPRV